MSMVVLESDKGVLQSPSDVPNCVTHVVLGLSHLHVFARSDDAAKSAYLRSKWLALVDIDICYPRIKHLGPLAFEYQDKS